MNVKIYEQFDNNPKVKFISTFTRPQVFPNVYDRLSSVEHKWRYFEIRWNKRFVSHWLTSNLFILSKQRILFDFD